MSVQKLTESHFKVKDINRKWMDAAVSTFGKQKALGKLPLLWDAHNEKGKAAKVIGRLDNLRVQDMDGSPWMVADVIITDEAHKAKFLAGASPSKSVEFQPDNHYLRGLALLDGHEGHFDYGIPDFVPEGLYDELVALGADSTCTVLCHSAANTATGAIPMTKEELQAMLLENNKALLAEVDKKLSANPKSSTTDVDAALAEVKASADSRVALAEAKANRKAKIDTYSVALHAKSKTPLALVRKKLEGFQTDEGMDTYYEGAMAAKDEDVKLGIEREHGDAPDLKAEFEEMKARYKDAHGVELRQSFDDYKRLAASLTPEGIAARNDRHSARGVTSVRNTEEAFA